MDEPKQIVNPEHISYREYKKRLSKNPHQNFVLFISAFFILLLAFLGMAKIMSPDVDIAIGDEPEVTYEQEGIVRGNVDDRLKRIQDEDNGLGASAESTLQPELDEKVVIPEKKQESEPLKVQEDLPVVLEHTKPQERHSAQNNENNVQTQPKKVEEFKTQDDLTRPNAAPVPPASLLSSAAPKTYKVYVGNYASAAQAEVAKGIISESNVGVNPFVKNVNGSYTLQAGSCSSSDKANSVANDLLKNNFPARVVAE